MTKLFSREWLEKQLVHDDGEFIAAGNPDFAGFQDRLEAAKAAKATTVGTAAFAAAVETIRKEEGIDVQELSKRTRLSAEELQGIAAAATAPSLRIVSSIAKALNVKPAKLAVIAGLAEVSGSANDEVMVRYATLSTGMRSMELDKKALVSEWVKFMTED